MHKKNECIKKGKLKGKFCIALKRKALPKKIKKKIILLQKK